MALENLSSITTWNPSRFNDYSKDCLYGRWLFDEILQHMKKTGDPYTLSRVIEAQVKAGTFEAVEIGFHAALTEHLLKTTA